MNTEAVPDASGADAAPGASDSAPFQDDVPMVAEPSISQLIRDLWDVCAVPSVAANALTYHSGSLSGDGGQSGASFSCAKQSGWMGVQRF